VRANAFGWVGGRVLRGGGNGGGREIRGEGQTGEMRGGGQTAKKARGRRIFALCARLLEEEEEVVVVVSE